MDDDPITRALDAVTSADRRPADELVPLLYDRLRELARAQLDREAAGRTLQPTALVHEAWLRLVAHGDPGWDGRRHFLAAAGRAMRRILVEEARRRRVRSPRDGARWTALDADGISGVDRDPAAVVDVDALLTELDASDPRKAEIVHLRFFAGLSNAEVAEVLGISVATVEREWRFARALLARRLGE